MTEVRKDVEALPVVAHLEGRHKASCAVFDPVPDRCDCGVLREPLVRRSDALAALSAAEQRITDLERASKEGWRYAKECDDGRKEAEQRAEAAQADARRWRELVQQHEFDDDQATHNNYGRTYPKRTLCVFQDDGEDGLEPVPCDPGELAKVVDAVIDAHLFKEASRT